jgi:RNA 2',3'-cyclic 3'-phosphodiesterase
VLAEQDSARVFFAAWPTPDVQRALGEIARQAQRECGGRAVPAHNVHLTLLFIGDIARERVASLEALGSAVVSPGFTLQVDRMEYWRHNRILWAGVEECPQPLRILVERVQQAAAAAGFRFDSRPYVPHVTLLREARRAPKEGRFVTVSWPVTELALVQSVQKERGRVYEVVRSWPLTA